MLYTVINCGPLTDPANEQVDTSSGTTFGNTATYICDDGYTLNGTQSQICTATGKWTSTPPFCLCTSSLGNQMSTPPSCQCTARLRMEGTVQEETCAIVVLLVFYCLSL